MTLFEDMGPLKTHKYLINVGLYHSVIQICLWQDVQRSFTGHFIYRCGCSIANNLRCRVLSTKSCTLSYYNNQIWFQLRTGNDSVFIFTLFFKIAHFYLKNFTVCRFVVRDRAFPQSISTRNILRACILSRNWYKINIS